MMSINLAEDQVPSYLDSVGGEVSRESVRTACINSPSNCTLSGPASAINAIKAQADKEGIFTAVLKTGVAYHSPAMLPIADEYLKLMGTLESNLKGAEKQAAIPMVSTVTGKPIPLAELAAGKYWVDNMVSPVKFAQAVQVMTQQSATLKTGLDTITDLVEVGPHPALRRPVKDIIGQAGNRKKDIRYTSALNRTQPAVQATLELAGQLYAVGLPISVAAVNQQAPGASAFLVDCPEYPFDHSQRHWSETRLSQDYRLRGGVKGETLGVRASDWNPLEPRWRNFLCIETTPWIGDHRVSVPSSPYLEMYMY